MNLTQFERCLKRTIPPESNRFQHLMIFTFNCCYRRRRQRRMTSVRWFEKHDRLFQLFIRKRITSSSFKKYVTIQWNLWNRRIEAFTSMNKNNKRIIVFEDNIFNKLFIVCFSILPFMKANSLQPFFSLRSKLSRLCLNVTRR